MKDQRVERLAGNLINYSVELKKGEKLLIEMVGSETMLVKELVKQAYRAGRVPFFARVISFSAKPRTSLAFSRVVEIVSCSNNDAAKFRRKARRCSLVRLKCRPATR